jgi:Inner membrane protein YgaP-like, transmembrane domain
MNYGSLVPLDRAARAGLGLLLLASPLLELETYPYNLFGIVLLGTAFASFCPLYAAVRWAFRTPPKGLGPHAAEAKVRA